MAINRFSRSQATRGYQPLSFQELAYAPTQMRQREDALMNARDKILNDMNNFTGVDQYGEEVEGIKNNLRERVNTLTKKIKDHGVGDMHYIDDFRNFRNEYNKAVSETGVLGMSSAIKNSLDQNKTAYYQDAQKKGLPADAIARGWAKEVAKYKEKLPGKLSEFQGSLPSFNPNMAPNKVAFEDKAIKYNQLMGMIKKQYPGSEQKPVYDNEGNFQGYEFYDTNGEIISNDENIAYFKNLMATEIMDPNSDMRQYADYIGMSPKEMMYKFDMIGGMMRKHQESMSKSKSGSSVPKDSTKERHGGDVTELRSTNNASAEIPNSEDTQSLMNAYAELDRNPDISEEEKEAQKRAMLSAYNNRMKIEGSDDFKNSINTEIQNIIEKDKGQNSTLAKYGIESWEDYQNFLRDPKNHKDEEITTGYSFGSPIKARVNPVNEVKNVIQPIYEKEVGRGKYAQLTNSEQMTLGTGDSDEDSRELLTQAVGNEDRLESLIMSGAIEVQEEGSMNFSAIAADPDDERTEKFKSGIQQALYGGGKIQFGAINSGDMMSAPELQYSVVDKDGNRQRFTIDLSKDSELADEVLGENSEFYKNLSPKARRTVDAMRENMEYRGLAVSVGEDAPQFDRNLPNERFSADQTANIRRYAQQRDEEAFGFSPQSTEEPNSRDAYALQNRFFSSNDPDVRYNVEMNPDNSYSSYKKNERTGEVEPFTFKNYLDKKFAAAYLQNNSRNPDMYPMDFLNEPEAEQMKREHYIDYIMELVENTGDLDNPSKSMIAYNDSAPFRKAIKGIYHLMDRVRNRSTTLEQSADEIDTFIGMIENKTVQSKRPKLIL